MRSRPVNTTSSMPDASLQLAGRWSQFFQSFNGVSRQGFMRNAAGYGSGYYGFTAWQQTHRYQAVPVAIITGGKQVAQYNWNAWRTPMPNTKTDALIQALRANAAAIKARTN